MHHIQWFLVCNCSFSQFSFLYVCLGDLCGPVQPEKKMDLFNKLPDPVVSHILSFLPTTKEAASTSVLAKRWRNLFAFVPNLNLDGDSKSFMDFVDRVLALQGDTPIKEFSLNAKTGVDPDRVDRWICNVLRRGVTHLDLFVAFGEEYSLPYEISVSKTLVELKT